MVKIDSDADDAYDKLPANVQSWLRGLYAELAQDPHCENLRQRRWTGQDYWGVEKLIDGRLYWLMWHFDGTTVVIAYNGLAPGE